MGYVVVSADLGLGYTDGVVLVVGLEDLVEGCALHTAQKPRLKLHPEHLVDHRLGFDPLLACG